MIADLCSLSLPDMYEFAIAYVEYEDVGNGVLCREDIVEEQFGGRSVGWRALEIIDNQRSEVTAYLPANTVELQYVRTIKDGIYVLARTLDKV